MMIRGADLLKTGRAIRGFTQDEVAQVYGISTKTYRNWETGKTAVSFDDLLALCDQVFKLPLAKLSEVANYAV
ncbi:XRE family transcriptional regulator [Shewanella sp. Choline-02u-19]|uniref:helix-turn-helix transcriptional regulator n=1 Tax=unclassified Shewanella TaxID=196818 RepID=UPI000C33E0C3|nr:MULTISPECIES: helix-turn-helix transcriptional regulator [unclassified Shewanella]PKH62188.1 XRE family transcriptional regulator [Shewanella sp. Bg11-22]PKI27935.1 XRE family transcriptional regulator [Shewanella sp. Choline-02u-19]